MTTRSQLAPYLRQIGLVGGHHGPRASAATPLSWRSTDRCCDPELSVNVNVVLGRPRGEPALAAGLGIMSAATTRRLCRMASRGPPPPSHLPHIPVNSRPAGCAAAASDPAADAGVVDACPDLWLIGATRAHFDQDQHRLENPINASLTRPSIRGGIGDHLDDISAISDLVSLRPVGHPSAKRDHLAPARDPKLESRPDHTASPATAGRIASPSASAA